MKLAYFPNQIARNGAPVLEAILNGAKYHGIDTVVDNLDADMAVIWSVLWRGRMATNKMIYQHYRSHDRPIIIVDVGALKREYTWKISLNHINRLGYYGHREDLDLDRPAKLGISLGHHTNTKSSILLAAQHTSSLQVQDVNLAGWLDQQIDAIRQVCDRPLILRPHPRCRIDLQRFQRKNIIIQQPISIPNTYDSFDLELDYHAMVNYNSGPGIQAAIAGVRPIVDITSLAAPVSININDLEHPYDTDRERWLIEICHTEYTLEEIAQGRWLERLHLI